LLSGAMFVKGLMPDFQWTRVFPDTSCVTAIPGPWIFGNQGSQVFIGSLDPLSGLTRRTLVAYTDPLLFVDKTGDTILAATSSAFGALSIT